jgi:hypothetical protein
MCSHCEITVPPRREHRPEATGSMARTFGIPSPAPSASHDRLGDPKVLCTTTATTSSAQSRSGRKVLYVQHCGNGSHVMPRAVRYGPRGQRRVARRPHRCHRPMSLPCPRMGGISSPEAIGQQREGRVYAKPFLAPEAFQLVRGRPFSRMPASVDGEITACPVLPGSVATTRYCCGRRRAGLDAPSEANGRLPRYERICKGILLADGARLAELIQKRTSLGSALDQSGLLSWPIFLLLPGGRRDHRPALHIICARRARSRTLYCTGAGDDQITFHGSCDLARGP